jgi:hypothetical protein
MRLRCKPQFGESPCCIHDIAVRPLCTDTCASRARAASRSTPNKAPSKSPSIVVCRRPEGSRSRAGCPPGCAHTGGDPTAGATHAATAAGRARTGAEVPFEGVPLRARRKRELPVADDDRTAQRRCARARAAPSGSDMPRRRMRSKSTSCAIRGSGSAPACHRRAQHRTRLQQTARHVSARPMLRHCDLHAGPAAGALRLHGRRGAQQPGSNRLACARHSRRAGRRGQT